MNFVDAQPNTCLDYAWTMPSQTPASSLVAASKPSKTTRKQNRCCDQCRRGKRACDATIMEDSLLGGKNGDPEVHPAMKFNYSDAYGFISKCGNCEKTKKECTFEWLRSQRVSQASSQPGATPPTKRRRTSSNQNHSETVPPPQALPPTSVPFDGLLPHNQSFNLGVTFADFPGGGIPGFGFDFVPSYNAEESLSSSETPGGHLGDVLGEVDGSRIEHDDSGQGSSVEGTSDAIYDSVESGTPSSLELGQQQNGTQPIDKTLVRTRKRRRRSSSSTLSLPCALPFASNTFLSSANNIYLAEGLLRIYHDSFENALACWLTERTCPYSKDSEVSLANDSGPDWNRIYHRVFRLDRLATPIRGRRLTITEDRAASRAINSAIFSFATQWAQASSRSKAKYPFHSENGNAVFSGAGDAYGTATAEEFDRKLQVKAWHEARMALQDAGEIESFRVVVAQMVFSLTQKPMEAADEEQANGTRSASPEDLRADKEVSECAELLEKLDLTIEKDGPPVHLEQGLRLIHSLRSRMAMSRVAGHAAHPKSSTQRCGKQCRPRSNELDAADRATVDLLFWLGVMFDTLSSAMHRRPLVVSDEDSDIYSSEPRPAVFGSDALDKVHVKNEGPWDDYLLARQRKRLQGNAVRWPCSYDQAAAFLCDAAPVKVLLFRKVTRIQTLVSRNVLGERIEKALKAALDVYEHWNKLYAPFIRDCIEYHDSLHPRVQSWYICLTGHWHLATLLLADLIEMVDHTGLGIETHRRERESSKFVERFRETNCNTLSELARRACPRDDASFSQSPEFHFAVNEGPLLTEPWTAVMIRAFAKAGVILLESEDFLPQRLPEPLVRDQRLQRADDCVKALWYLGRKSDVAMSVARILGDAVKEKRKGVEDFNDIGLFLQSDLWDEGLQYG